MTKNKRWIIYLGMAAVIIAVIVAVKTSRKPAKDTVREVRPVVGTIQTTITSTATVQPQNRLEIKPPINGRIDEILVKEGDRVKAGQTLAWMSSTERAALLDAARSRGPEAVKYWEDVIKPAPLISPIDGEVIVSQDEPGQTVTSAEAVLVLSDRLIVQAQVDETDIGRIRVNQQANIVLDAYPDKPIPGHVEQIAYESQTINNVTVYMINVLPESVPPFFRSGMSATVNFKMDERTNVLKLPLDAVKKKGGRSYVFRRQNGTIKAIQVQTGLENSSEVEIMSGLSEGDELVIPTQNIIQDTLERDTHRGPFNFFGGGRR